jgi:hypothetical protein
LPSAQLRPATRFLRRKIIPNDDCIRRERFPLEQAEHAAIKYRETSRRTARTAAARCLARSNRAAACAGHRCDRRSSPTRAGHDAEPQHYREHLRTACGSVTQIGAVRDQMHCGMDIATQHATPAMLSNTCSARGDMPSVDRPRCSRCRVGPSAALGARRFNASASAAS